MTRSRKKSGMTSLQMGILIGLGVLVLLLCGVFAFLLLGGGLFSLAPRSTATIQPTSTPLVLPTITSTVTPVAVPYEELIPEGWVQHRTSLMEIWLPPSFKPADGEKLREAGKKQFEEAGLGNVVNADSMATWDLVVADEVSGSPIYRSVVSVAYSPLATESLDAEVEDRLRGFPNSMTIVERKKVMVGTLDAVRVVYEIRLNSIYLDYLCYYFVDGGTLWRVRFDAEINEFYMQLPDIEKSIQTFRVLK